MSARIIQGDCLTVLRTLPAESVHCVVTSPPYWGLRRYSTEPQLWGGTFDCDHEWNRDRYYSEQTAAATSTASFAEPGEANKERLKEARWREDDTCNKCGAWRGELGLEPNPEMYVAHLVEIFREARRVLRNDGTFFLNIGDTYATGSGSGRAMGGKHFGKTNPVIDGGAFPQCQPNRRKLPGLKAKDLIGIPWMTAFALRSDGWYIRAENIWTKPNTIPSSAKDRTTRTHEHVFLFTKRARYFYDADAVAEPVSISERNRRIREMRRNHDGQYNIRRNREDHGTNPYGATSVLSSQKARYKAYVSGTRNRRSVWSITTTPFQPPAGYEDIHFATFPKRLAEICIKAGCPKGGVVLDPFAGAGTTGIVAVRLGREFQGIELNARYAAMANASMENDSPLFNRVEVTQA